MHNNQRLHQFPKATKNLAILPIPRIVRIYTFLASRICDQNLQLCKNAPGITSNSGQDRKLLGSVGFMSMNRFYANAFTQNRRNCERKFIVV